MGNSMRSFLGNMCGAEESKRVASEGAHENKPLPNQSNQGNQTEKPADEAPEGESFQTCPVETSGSHTPGKRKHRSGSQRKYNGLYEVDSFKPETVNVTEADDIFKKSANTYQPFADECSALRAAIDSFEAVFSNDKKRVEFEQAITAFQELLDEAAKESDGEKKERNRDKLDAGREQHVAIVASGYRVLDLINLVRPQVEEDIEAAGKLDVKESAKGGQAKGGQADGSQLGLVSKLAVPGKHRRNVKSMKKCQSLLVSVADETQEVLSIAERIKVNVPKTNNDDNEKSTELDTSPPAVPIENVKSADADAVAADSGAESVPAGETAAIDVPTTGGGARDVSSPHSSSLPNGSMPRLRDASCADGEEEGRMIDYGSFWMLDPTNDDLTLMKRSRSLDSVVSRGSRASMSRYGSYEFVTNMEIQIAEKGEAQRAENVTQ